MGIFGKKSNSGGSGSSGGAEPYDSNCGRYASDIAGYDAYRDQGQSRADFVKDAEPSYNAETGSFVCDDCPPNKDGYLR